MRVLLLKTRIELNIIPIETSGRKNWNVPLPNCELNKKKKKINAKSLKGERKKSNIHVLCFFNRQIRGIYIKEKHGKQPTKGLGDTTSKRNKQKKQRATAL